MSVKKPRGANEGPNKLYRRAIFLVLACSPLFASYPTCSSSSEPAQEVDDYFDGVEIVPDDTPKKEPTKMRKEKKPTDSDKTSDPFCTFDTCKYA